MSHLDDIRSKLLEPAIQSGDAVNLEKASAAWKAVAEAAKLEAEAVKLGDEAVKLKADKKKVDLEAENIGKAARQEGLRFWLSILVPIITAAGVIGTLTVQMRQLQENSRIQQEANEATQWREALQSAQLPKPIASVPGTILLKSFLHSTRYRGQAREISLTLLGFIGDRDTFENLFSGVVETTDWTNYQDIVHTSRRLYDRYHEVDDQVKAGVPTGFNVPPKVLLPILQDELVIVGRGLERFLREHRRPSGAILDLKHGNFSSQHFSHLDFSQASITDTVIGNSTVDGADFSDITEFEDSVWSQTAWWRAEKSNVILLDYLIQNYPFDPKAEYSGRVPSQEEYCSGTQRLGKKAPSCP